MAQAHIQRGQNMDSILGHLGLIFLQIFKERSTFAKQTRMNYALPFQPIHVSGKWKDKYIFYLQITIPKVHPVQISGWSAFQYIYPVP